MDNTLVIGDLHGNPEALEDILIRSGACKNFPMREPGWCIIQLGDLLNFAPENEVFHGFKSYDFETMHLVNTYHLIDRLLLGNHEAWFTHGFESGKWAGMARLDQLHPELMREVNYGMLTHGYYSQYATEVHGYVISHAGIMPQYRRGKLSQDAKEAVEQINQMVFPAIIHDDYNGILWARGTDAFHVDENAWPQIIGHTPLNANPQWHDHSKCWSIDGGDYVNNKGTGIVWVENKWEIVY